MTPNFKERISKFNHIIGNSPSTDVDAFWEQVELQASLVLEEAIEQYEAAKNRDLVELVDGDCDVHYLQTYVDELIENINIPLKVAMDMVVVNNDQKYTKHESMAHISKMIHCDNGVECYVEKVEFEGDVYFTVKRSSDGKVMKLKDHVSPNIRATIPDAVFNKYNQCKETE